MSSAGHVFDAIARMKFNRDQLNERREKYAKLKSQYHESLHRRGYIPREEKIPKEVVEKVKAEIRESARRRQRRSTTLSIILTIIVIAILIFLVLKYANY